MPNWPVNFVLTNTPFTPIKPRFQKSKTINGKLADGNRRHFATPPTVSTRNDV